uniref:Uncharacterized protein n=1 Tax=Arundo donax TaxID=35708 RepID=A0A0A9FQ70_ARUDO
MHSSRNRAVRVGRTPQLQNKSSSYLLNGGFIV